MAPSERERNTGLSFLGPAPFRPLARMLRRVARSGWPLSASSSARVPTDLRQNSDQGVEVMGREVHEPGGRAVEVAAVANGGGPIAGSMLLTRGVS